MPWLYEPESRECLINFVSLLTNVPDHPSYLRRFTIFLFGQVLSGAAAIGIVILAALLRLLIDDVDDFGFPLFPDFNVLRMLIFLHFQFLQLVVRIVFHR
jgi:hypothetical protein